MTCGCIMQFLLFFSTISVLEGYTSLSTIRLTSIQELMHIWNKKQLSGINISSNKRCKALAAANSMENFGLVAAAAAAAPTVIDSSSSNMKVQSAITNVNTITTAVIDPTFSTGNTATSSVTDYAPQFASYLQNDVSVFTLGI